MMNKNIRLIALCYLLTSQSCSSTQQEEYFPDAPIRYPAPNGMYGRDSAYIGYTLHEFNAFDVIGYGGINLLRVDVDTILYSPDTLKFFSFNIINYKPKETELEDSNYYEGHAILGYRLKTTDPWIVYPVTHSVFVDYTNYNMVRDRLRKAYIKNFAGPMSGVWNCKTKKFETYPSYNITDRRFWDSSFIWQKDVSISGYYDFQLSGNGNPDMPDPILKIPPLHYPDSLLKLYYENRW